MDYNKESILEEISKNLNEYLVIYDNNQNSFKYHSANLEKYKINDLNEFFAYFLSKNQVNEVLDSISTLAAQNNYQSYFNFQKAFRIDKEELDFKYISLECKRIIKKDVDDFFITINKIDNFILTDDELIKRIEELEQSERELIKIRESLLRKNEALTDIAIKDELTGVFNRYYFDMTLKEEIERNERYQGSISLIIFDLDKFKRVNDRYGHDEGDSVLKKVASLIRHIIKKPDIFARWGGEEFVILLPQTNLLGAYTCAERLRRRLGAIEHRDKLKVTASFGVAEKNYGESAEEWFDRVDKMLYRAKKNGRNRVEMDKADDTSPVSSLKLSWRANWASGDRVIDIQHRYLIRLMNRLSYATLTNGRQKEVELILDRILLHTKYHFEYEEKVLKEIEFSMLERHHVQHQDLLRKIEKKVEEFKEEKISFLEFFNFILKDLIDNHLIKEDATYFPFIWARN